MTLQKCENLQARGKWVLAYLLVWQDEGAWRKMCGWFLTKHRLPCENPEQCSACRWFPCSLFGFLHRSPVQWQEDALPGTAYKGATQSLGAIAVIRFARSAVFEFVAQRPKATLRRDPMSKTLAAWSSFRPCSQQRHRNWTSSNSWQWHRLPARFDHEQSDDAGHAMRMIGHSTMHGEQLLPAPQLNWKIAKAKDTYFPHLGLCTTWSCTSQWTADSPMRFACITSQY